MKPKKLEFSRVWDRTDHLWLWILRAYFQ